MDDGVAYRSNGPIEGPDPLEAVRALAEGLVYGGVARLAAPDSR